MLTKNFYSYMRAAFSAAGKFISFVKTDGTTTNLRYSNNFAPFAVMNKWSVNNNGFGVSFGTGTTPATMSDYSIESDLGGTQISVSYPDSVSYSRDNTFDMYSVGFGITNKTSDAITISEVGLIIGTTSGSSEYAVLVDRTVLDAPVTIPPHETKHIAYTIRFNYGDAV